MDNTNPNRSIVKDLVFPILVLAGIIVVFLNIKDIPYVFNEKDKVVVRYFAKVVMTIILPLTIIQIFYKNKSDFGIYFPRFLDSFKLSIRAYAIGGPAGITFLIIGILGWGFEDWAGAITLSFVYLLVFYFIPKVTKGLPTRNVKFAPDNGTSVLTFFSLMTLIIAFFTYEYVPVISKILYYIFIVGFGEELLFRGFIQSSFNRYFGKSFKIANVEIGWGLYLSALLFGMTHALVVMPPSWPWALFTFSLGLSLGFIREKDGSILGAVLLHAMFDMPLVFVN